MSTLPKAMYTVSVTPTEIPRVFFTETEQILLTFVWNRRGPRRAKATLRKETGLEASRSLTSHSAEKRQSPNGAEMAQKQAHGPEGRDREPRIQPTRGVGVGGSVKLRQGGHGHTEGKDRPHNKWCWENWTPHTPCWLHSTPK